MDLYLSGNCNISKNDLTNNDNALILLASGNNDINENKICDSSILGLSLNDSYNNNFYHNSFINNTHQIQSSNSTSTWDDGSPFGGNYWSDIADSNQDGLADAPYIIDENNTDHHPFMGTLYSFNVRHMYTHRIETVIIISNSTVENVLHGFVDNAASPAGADWILELTGVVDQGGTVGFCRITFPNDMMDSSSYPVLLGAPEGTKISSRIVESNGTYTTLYFTYNLPVSRSTIWILPEFPSYLILPLFFITTLFGVVVYRKRLAKARAGRMLRKIIVPS